jgi:hypothetical protein
MWFEKNIPEKSQIFKIIFLRKKNCAKPIATPPEHCHQISAPSVKPSQRFGGPKSGHTDSIWVCIPQILALRAQIWIGRRVGERQTQQAWCSKSPSSSSWPGLPVHKFVWILNWKAIGPRPTHVSDNFSGPKMDIWTSGREGIHQKLLTVDY